MESGDAHNSVEEVKDAQETSQPGWSQRQPRPQTTANHTIGYPSRDLLDHNFAHTTKHRSTL